MAASPTTVLFEVATLCHVHLVAARMRKADRDEVQASSGERPARALRKALRASEIARTVLVDGEPLMMFGIASAGGVAVPWALTTDLVDRRPTVFWKVTKFALGELRKLYPVMVQAIDARHTQALAWVERLGFDVAKEPEPFGFAGLPFHRITLRS